MTFIGYKKCQYKNFNLSFVVKGLICFDFDSKFWLDCLQIQSILVKLFHQVVLKSELCFTFLFSLILSRLCGRVPRKFHERGYYYQHQPSRKTRKDLSLNLTTKTTTTRMHLIVVWNPMQNILFQNYPIWLSSQKCLIFSSLLIWVLRKHLVLCKEVPCRFVKWFSL